MPERNLTITAKYVACVTGSGAKRATVRASFAKIWKHVACLFFR